MDYTHKQLCEIAEKWLRKRKKQNIMYPTFPVTCTEIACFNGINWNEIPDAFGVNNYESCVIECKISRADFRADLKKPFRKENGMGNLRLYLCPENLIQKEDLPEKWGLLYVNEKGRVIEIQKPEHHQLSTASLKAERQIMYSLLRRAAIKKEFE